MGIGATLLNIVPDLSEKLQRMHFQPISIEGVVDTDIGSKGLPFWPETISDSKGSEWAAKNIPGGSHPLYQWIQGTERVITFSLVLLRDSLDVNVATEPEDIYNIDVAAAITWLRMFVYPLYENGTGIVVPPPPLIIVLPNTGIGGGEGFDDLICICTQCDVDYQAFFNDGTPRMATVNMSFAEIVQIGDVAQFYSRDLYYSTVSNYRMDPTPG